MGECVFCGISEGKLPAEFVFKDEEIVVFRSKSPRAPVHLLLIPRIHIEDLESLSDKLVLSIKKRIVELVKELDLDRKGYRVITNGGTAKAVAHLHFHLLGNVTVSREV